MPRKRAEPVTITEEQILQYANVPVYVAAQYIGWSTTTMYYALRDGRAPFGFASCHENEQDETGWAYNICPRLLVGYKNGTLPCMGLHELVKLLIGELEALLGGDLLPKLMLKSFAQAAGKLEGVNTVV